MKANCWKWFLTSGVLAVIVGLAIILPAEPTLALNPQPLPPGMYFGPMTLSPSQSVRINVANLGSSLSEEPPDPCVVRVMLVDQNGDVLQNETLTLAPGKAGNVVYPQPSVTASITQPAGVVQVRGVVLSLTPLKPGKSPIAFAEIPPGLLNLNLNHWVLQSSLEVIDSETGQTTQVLNPVERIMLNPQPLPPG